MGTYNDLIANYFQETMAFYIILRNIYSVCEKEIVPTLQAGLDTKLDISAAIVTLLKIVVLSARL